MALGTIARLGSSRRLMGAFYRDIAANVYHCRCYVNLRLSGGLTPTPARAKRRFYCATVAMTNYQSPFNTVSTSGPQVVH